MCNSSPCKSLQTGVSEWRFSLKGVCVCVLLCYIDVQLYNVCQEKFPFSLYFIQKQWGFPCISISIFIHIHEVDYALASDLKHINFDIFWKVSPTNCPPRRAAILSLLHLSRDKVSGVCFGLWPNTHYCCSTSGQRPRPSSRQSAEKNPYCVEWLADVIRNW